MIYIETTVEAPRERAWAAYVTPDAIVQWNAASDDWHTPTAMIDLRVGGRLCWRMEAKDGSMGFDFEGDITHVDEGRALDYILTDRRVEVRFADVEGGTRVTVAFEPDENHSPDMQRDGWKAILENFRRFVERQD